MDKLWHVVAGALLYLVLGPWGVVSAAVGKEVYDGSREPMYEHVGDVAATVLGGFFASILLQHGGRVTAVQLRAWCAIHAQTGVDSVTAYRAGITVSQRGDTLTCRAITTK